MGAVGGAGAGPDGAGPGAGRARLTDALLWLAALGGATAAMLPARARLDKAHVALVYLLVVLGASARGGRALGLGVAGAAFLLFDTLFLPPYGGLAVADPLDYLVLVAFLATGATAAQLLDRARREARDARARADDVDRIAALGARALTAGRAEAALAGVADAVRAALALDRCDAWPAEALEAASLSGGVPHDRAPNDRAPNGAAPGGAALPVTVVLAAARGVVVAERRDGTVREGGPLGAFDARPPGDARAPAGDAPDGLAGDGARARRAGGAPAGRGRSGVRDALGTVDPAELVALVLPLAVREGGGARLVGALRLARAAGFDVPAAGWRTLDALAYYAALAADRVRLAGAEERAAALAEAGRLKDALMAAVSHDLRTPLTTIKATAQQLGASLRGASPADAESAGRAATIEREADRLARLVGDLLDFSRLGAGAMPLAAEVTPVDDLFDVVQQGVTGALAGRPLELRLPPGAPLLLGRFDLGATARVLVNLVENAHKYAPPGTPVELEACEVPAGGDGPPRLALAVRDRGPGIPAAERDRVFEPFYRAAGAPVDVSGVGLGLAIARQLAEAQGGTLVYAPRPGGGSVFTLELPGATAPPNAEGEPTD